MIVYTTSSILDSDSDALVNPVNTVGVMGAGLALEFSRRFPGLESDYRTACRKGLVRPGTLHLWKGRHPVSGRTVVIVNFPTKTDWRMPSMPEYIEKGLIALARDWRDYGVKVISFPMLGCGLGGLSWNTQVRPLMEKHLRPIRDLVACVHIANRRLMTSERAGQPVPTEEFTF